MKRFLIAMLLALVASTSWAAEVRFTSTTGRTFRWYPMRQALSGWATFAETVTESPTGMYTATVDSDILATDWALFEGASQPASFADSIGSIDTLQSNLDETIGEVLEDTGTTLHALVDELETRLSAIRAGYLDKLNIAGNVASATDVTSIESGTTQPRINRRAGVAFRFKVSDRDDLTHKCTKPAVLKPGTVNNRACEIDMAPLFGPNDFVDTVGTPVVSDGDVTASALGPRDTNAMIALAGTASAGETFEVSVPVLMDSGEEETVVLVVEVLSE